MAKLLRLLAFSITCFCSTAWADPINLITDQAWLEDPTGQMTLEQVQQRPLQSLGKKDFNQGYRDSAFWIRLRIDPTLLGPSIPDQRLVMRIPSPHLDDLQLYDPMRQGSPPQITGDLHPQQDKSYRSLNLTFVLPRGEVARDVWLRVKTTSSTLTEVRVLAESDARALDWEQDFASMGYIAVLVICLGWATMSWQLLHDRLSLYYVAREMVAIAYAVASLGGLRLLSLDGLPTGWLNSFNNFMACFVGVVFIWFDTKLLSHYRPHPLAIGLLRTGYVACGIATLLTLVGYTPLGFKINSWVMVSLPLVLFFSALSTRAWSDGEEKTAPIPRWGLLGLYLIFPILVLVNRAMLLGWIPSVVIASHVVLAYILIGSVAMLVFLQLRASRLYAQQQKVQLRLDVAEKNANDERDRREEQERFLAMLGHELRNPLAAVSLLADQDTEDGKQIRRAVGDMAQVLERSLQTGRLADGRFNPAMEEVDVHQLVHEMCQRSDRIDLTNFEPGTQALSDRLCLQIVLSNLVDNALKYSPPDSRVQVDCAVEQQGGSSSLRIVLSNLAGAAGVPDASNVYQKYYRSAKAHSQIGSGLGLYLTKSLVDMLKARIEYVQAPQSQPERVVFLVELPLPA